MIWNDYWLVVCSYVLNFNLWSVLVCGLFLCFELQFMKCLGLLKLPDSPFNLFLLQSSPLRFCLCFKLILHVTKLSSFSIMFQIILYYYFFKLVIVNGTHGKPIRVVRINLEALFKSLKWTDPYFIKLGLIDYSIFKDKLKFT